ncbi:hypothetical protein ACF061_25545 [Streptomyces sp. NPDC015220]|uniref:hypothetical protein n=1 Tax=Streptomyces sp. NPDC015220 TaxID=3364947 RepID=UPI0036F7C505
MTDHRSEAPGENGRPVPRDMPDQQAHGGEDPWEAADRSAGTGSPRSGPAADKVPDTDEAGTDRRGAPQPDAARPEEQPEPEEPPG